MLHHRLALLLLAPTTGLFAACLSTPPGQVVAVDGPPEVDAAVADAPDAEILPPPPPCTSGECVQLLAIGLYQHEPGTTSSIALLRRDATAGSWQRMADIAGSSDYNVYDLDWGDCCGPKQVVDGLPDLLAVHWNHFQYSELRYSNGPNPILSATQFHYLPGIEPLSIRGHARWLDVDGDEDLDILTGRPTAGGDANWRGVTWFRNLPTGFSNEIVLDAANGLLDVGNWDDDVDPEILVVDDQEPGEGIRILDRTAGGDTLLPVLPDHRQKAILCDVVGTHHPDIAVAGHNQLTYIYPNRGSAVDGNWLDLADGRSYAAVWQAYPPMACGDLDGDGDDDLLMSSGTGLVAVFHDTAELVSVWPLPDIGAETAISDLILADVDHDGLPEILVTLGDAADGAEPSADDVAFLLPNRTPSGGELTLGAPELLLSSRQDAMSLAYVEFPLPR